MDVLLIIAPIVIVVLAFYQILLPIKQKRFSVINKLVCILALIVLVSGYLTSFNNYQTITLSFVLIGLSVIFSTIIKR